MRSSAHHADDFPVPDPQVQLSSEPPLQYSDIVSLLATGVTTSELAGNAQFGKVHARQHKL